MADLGLATQEVGQFRRGERVPRVGNGALSPGEATATLPATWADSAGRMSGPTPWRCNGGLYHPLPGGMNRAAADLRPPDDEGSRLSLFWSLP